MDPTPENAPMVSYALAASSAPLLNPERGYYEGFNLVTSVGGAARARAEGHTLAITIVRLDAFRDSAISAAFLDQVRAGFGRVRQAGIKVILRFTYNSDDTSGDASKSRIMGHIAQLKPIMQENVDVISVLQAGLIGDWGEWHGSTHGLDNPTDRKDILLALLDALPASRQVQIRTPMYKEDAFPGGPLTAAEAYANTPRARIGHHNDCFLASANDYGTYDAPVSEWESYVAGDGAFTAIGGETCKVYAPRTSCEAAVAEMESNHWSYLNSQYHQDVLAGWASSGCGEEIANRLGYRLTVERVAHTERVAPGGILDVELDIKNVGFAAMYNQRPVELVVRSGDVRYVARLAGRDARAFKAGATTTLGARLRLPADMPAGSYELAIRLPDDADVLADDGRYAVQFANDTTFHSNGDQTLTDTIVVDGEAPGPKDPGATAFAEIAE